MKAKFNMFNPVASRWLIAFVVVFSLIAQPSFALEEFRKIDIIGKTMGPIVYRVVVVETTTALDKDQLGKAIQERLDHVNALMSTYQDDSDVTRFNKSRSKDWIEVHADTAKVMARALEIGDLTDGAFDVTVGPAVNLWNFGPEKTKFQKPSDSEIESIQVKIGYQNVSTRLDPPAIRKSIPEIEIDFSAIAKGYAVDVVAERLRELGCDRFLVEVGGEVSGQGLNQDGQPWRVGIERPKENTREIEAVSSLVDAAMATSGDYRNYFVHEGKRYSHAIDPRTCRPTSELLATACVVAPDCMTADALATALMVVGAAQARAICEKLDVTYYLVERSKTAPNDESRFTRHVSPSFPLGDGAKQIVSVVEKQGILPVFLSALVVFGLAILGMSAGAIFANKPVQGSCGGLASMATGETTCGVCNDPVEDCEEYTPEQTES